MLRREYLERELGYTYLKNGIYKKEWYGRVIMLDANNNKGYVKNENIYNQNDIKFLQIALNVLNDDLRKLKLFKEEKVDLYDVYKIKSTEVLKAQLSTFTKLSQTYPEEKSTITHIEVIKKVLEDRNEKLY